MNGYLRLAPQSKSFYLPRCVTLIPQNSYGAHRFRSKLAAKLKLNAPFAHTWLEIVAARWGTAAHLVFMFFGCALSVLGFNRVSPNEQNRLATNIIVSSMLILGGSATVTDLTGMSTIAVCPIMFDIQIMSNTKRLSRLVSSFL